MCECGCVSNDDRFRFPAPGKSFYILTLSGVCKNCDAPPGVTIELISPEDVLYEDYRRGEFHDGPLMFERWPDSRGVAIITGMRQHELVKVISPHLVGIDKKMFGDDGCIDEIGAEVIIDEMYEDSQVKPSLVKPVAAGVK